MKNKATHQGHCQCCGQLQKLPDGLLSTHGYSVIAGFFEGICRGAKELPYEQSCALIVSFIRQAEFKLEDIKSLIADDMKPVTEPKAWYHEYVPGKTIRSSGYVWRKVDLREDKKSYTGADGKEVHYSKIVFTDSQGKQHDAPYTDSQTYFPTLLGSATKMNQVHAKLQLEPIKAQIESYIKWQTKRVLDWKLVDTILIPEAK